MNPVALFVGRYNDADIDDSRKGNTTKRTVAPFCGLYLLAKNFSDEICQNLRNWQRQKQEFNGSERPPSAILPSKVRSSPKFIFRGSWLWVASASPISEK